MFCLLPSAFFGIQIVNVFTTTCLERVTASGTSRGHDFSEHAYGSIVGNRTRISGVTIQRPWLLDDNEHKKSGLGLYAKPTKKAVGAWG
jgi:hypothetical protein